MPKMEHTTPGTMSKPTKVIGYLGNPFQEESKDLYCERGIIRFQEFIHVLESEENLTFYEPIKKNKWTFFDKYQLL